MFAPFGCILIGFSHKQPLCILLQIKKSFPCGASCRAGRQRSSRRLRSSRSRKYCVQPLFSIRQVRDTQTQTKRQKRDTEEDRTALPHVCVMCVLCLCMYCVIGRSCLQAYLHWFLNPFITHLLM